MEGYWGDASPPAEVLDAHGFHTGDMGWRDEDGYFWITGRKREMIKSGAARIQSQGNRRVLLEHPEIEEAAVVGKPTISRECIRGHITVRPGRAARNPDFPAAAAPAAGESEAGSRDSVVVTPESIPCSANSASPPTRCRRRS